MAAFGNKGKKAGGASSKAAGKVTPQKQPKQPKQTKQPRQPKPVVPPDIFTLLLGLSALFLLMAMIVLGLNYYWYQALANPAVLPLNTWAR